MGKHQSALPIAHAMVTYLLDGKLLVGLDLDLTGLLASLLRDERDLEG